MTTRREYTATIQPRSHTAAAAPGPYTPIGTGHGELSSGYDPFPRHE